MITEQGTPCACGRLKPASWPMCHACMKAARLGPLYDGESVRCPACGQVQPGDAADTVAAWDGYEHACRCGEEFHVAVEVSVTYISPPRKGEAK